MGYERKIEKVIRLSVKKRTFDSIQMKEILDTMSKGQLQEYWTHFAVTRAFSRAESVPYWKSKQQQSRFESEHGSYLYCPKDKDESGRYIIDRGDFQNHILTCLNRYVNEEIEKKIRNKNMSLIERIRFVFAMASLILILPFCVVSVLACNKIGADSDTAKMIYNSIGIGMFFAWTCYILLSFIVPFVIRKK